MSKADKSQTNKKSKNKKISKLINKFEIIYIVIMLLDLVAYFSLNKYINMIILFFSFLSIALLLVYFLELLFDKKEKRTKYIDNILSITMLIHSLVIGILLGQICKCGYHYFHIIPIYIFALAEFVFYHTCIYNYKNEKNLTYMFVCFLVMNAVFVSVMLISKINMTAIHNSMLSI